MKIPTLIGVALIIALIASSGLWFFYRQKPQTRTKIEVSDLQVANTTDSSLVVVWQSNIPSQGKVVYGESENLNNQAIDIRDSEAPKERIVHFVPLKNLKPNTSYFYKIENDGVLYPEKAQGFKTASATKIDELNFSFLKPIKGTVLNTNLNPIDESLILLQIPGGQKLAAFSSTAGNFVLPLKLVFNENLDQILNIPQDTSANLIVKKGLLESKVKLLISDTTVNLPPITIGNNLDLSKYTQPPISTISIGQNKQVNLDFNADGRINSLDLAILRGRTTAKNAKLEEQVKFDINLDGIIDQKDIDEFSKALTGN